MNNAIDQLKLEHKGIINEFNREADEKLTNFT